MEDLCDGKDLVLNITREKFEQLCAHHFNKCLPIVEQVLKDAKVDKSKVDEVILVGGSTRIPKVQKLLSDFFGSK